MSSRRRQIYLHVAQQILIMIENQDDTFWSDCKETVNISSTLYAPNYPIGM